ncbi:MAG: Holliday junction resolvase RuvX [Deltaproteobacteria bacterium]|nr:Holliday junction resolvase RuvX [Deltaproteobacteria bacterium]
MRILGLDFGTKTIGVALSDELTITAQTLTSLSRTTLQRDLEALLQLIREHQVDEVVIGMPINMDGSRGPAAQAVDDFIDRLKSLTAVKIIPWDERLTTVAAERILLEGDLSRRKRRLVIDRLSAAIILQGYLDSRPKP